MAVRESKIPKLSPGNSPENAQLKCPKCGYQYLHHGNVEVYTRDREDGPSQKVLVSNGRVIPAIENVGGQNPSGRRGGIRVYFTCENGCKSALCIVQYKGETFLSWELEG